MATSDVDQRTLGNLAREISFYNNPLSSFLYQLLGLSVTLARKLYRARKLRKLDTSRDTKSLALYHHIIWLSREGLTILEVAVLPYTQENQYGSECLVLTAKLRASFHHVFCLFHNSPPVSQLVLTAAPTKHDAATSAAGGATSLSAAGDGGLSGAAAFSPRHGDGQRRSSGSVTLSPKDPIPPSAPATEATTAAAPAALSSTVQAARPRSKTTSLLRDPIPSMTSEASYVTNPYAANSGVERNSGHSRAFSSTAAPTFNITATTPPAHPPGLTPPRSSGGTGSTNRSGTAPNPSNFLLPSMNFVPRTVSYFSTVSKLAAVHLPGSHPLRLSVALEHAAFLWDCAHEHESARRLARRAIRDVYRAQEGMGDAEFEEAAELVAVLGRLMRRSSWDGTPRTHGSLRRVNPFSSTGANQGNQHPPPPPPPPPPPAAPPSGGGDEAGHTESPKASRSANPTASNAKGYSGQTRQQSKRQTGGQASEHGRSVSGSSAVALPLPPMAALSSAPAVTQTFSNSGAAGPLADLNAIGHTHQADTDIRLPGFRSALAYSGAPPTRMGSPSARPPPAAPVPAPVDANLPASYIRQPNGHAVAAGPQTKLPSAAAHYTYDTSPAGRTGSDPSRLEQEAMEASPSYQRNRRSRHVEQARLQPTFGPESGSAAVTAGEGVSQPFRGTQQVVEQRQSSDLPRQGVHYRRQPQNYQPFAGAGTGSRTQATSHSSKNANATTFHLNSQARPADTNASTSTVDSSRTIIPDAAAGYYSFVSMPPAGPIPPVPSSNGTYAPALSSKAPAMRDVAASRSGRRQTGDGASSGGDSASSMAARAGGPVRTPDYALRR